MSGPTGDEVEVRVSWKRLGVIAGAVITLVTAGGVVVTQARGCAWWLVQEAHGQDVEAATKRAEAAQDEKLEPIRQQLAGMSLGMSDLRKAAEHTAAALVVLRRLAVIQACGAFKGRWVVQPDGTERCLDRRGRVIDVVAGPP